MKKGKSLRLFILGSALALTIQMWTTDGIGAAETARGFYFSGNLRGNWIGDAGLRQVDTIGGGKVEFDPGVGFGLRGGYRFCDWFSLEGETGFAGNKISGMTGATVDDTYLYQVPYMVNTVFTIPRLVVTPFFGGGIGGTSSIIDTDHITVGNRTAFGDESTATFAYQLFAGIHFPINDQISLGVIYNFRGVDAPRWDEGDFPIEFGDLRNHSIGVSANFRF